MRDLLVLIVIMRGLDLESSFEVLLGGVWLLVGLVLRMSRWVWMLTFLTGGEGGGGGGSAVVPVVVKDWRLEI